MIERAGEQRFALNGKVSARGAGWCAHEQYSKGKHGAVRDAAWEGTRNLGLLLV
jgi:hypothetical protein